MHLRVDDAVWLVSIRSGTTEVVEKSKDPPKGGLSNTELAKQRKQTGYFPSPRCPRFSPLPSDKVSTSSCGLNKILKQAWKEKISTKDLISVMTIRSDGYILSYYCPYFDPAHIEFHLRQWPIFKIKESESISRCI